MEPGARTRKRLHDLPLPPVPPTSSAPFEEPVKTPPILEKDPPPKKKPRHEF